MLISLPPRWLLSMLVACAGAAAADTAAPPPLTTEDAWIRWLPAGLPAAGYLTLTDSGDAPAVLVGATSPSFASISLHRSVANRGLMTMEPVDKIRIQAHSSLNFALAHYHMMLMSPASTVKPGARIPITLRFEDGSSLTVEFEVRPAANP